MAQYRVSIVSRNSRENRDSRSPPQSLHDRHFSTIHAARPAGESCSAYDRVWGFVDWIAPYAYSSRTQRSEACAKARSSSESGREPEPV